MKTGLMAEESFERLGFHEQAMVIVPDTSVDVHAQGKKGFVAGLGLKEHRRDKSVFDDFFGGMWSRPRPGGH